MEIIITKKIVASESSGSAYSDAYKYYAVYGKIYNEEKTKFRRFKFAYLVWKEDLFEYCGYPDYLSISKQNRLADEFVWSFIENNRPSDFNNCSSFYKACDESIEEYNRFIRR